MTLAAILAAAAVAQVFDYPATVLSVTDGDTLRVAVAGWPEPFTPIGVRVSGIDTPESRRPPAKSDCEVALGLKAKAYARAMAKPGDLVVLHYRKGTRDKYSRVLASVTLPDGSDWAGRLIAAGLARRYEGGTKTRWCVGGKPAPAASAGAED